MIAVVEELSVLAPGLSTAQLVDLWRTFGGDDVKIFPPINLKWEKNTIISGKILTTLINIYQSAKLAKYNTASGLPERLKVV